MTSLNEIRRAATAFSKRWKNAFDEKSQAQASSRSSSPSSASMPSAHARLDALVDKAYGRSFSSDSDRVAHLFRLYAERSGKAEK